MLNTEINSIPKVASTYKSPNNKKTEKSAQLSPIHSINSERKFEENELIDIIHQLFEDDIKDERLNILQQRLANFPQNLIPSNIPHLDIVHVFEKYKITQNIIKENCLILVIECLSMVEDYYPIFNHSNYLNIAIEKISFSSPNSYLMLKVLANIFDSLEDKDNSLKSVCSLLPKLFDQNDDRIIDYLIHFFYNYSNSEFLTETGSMLISNSLYQIFEYYDKQSMNFSPFSIERIFYILNSLITKYKIDFSSILNHPIIKNKNLYLFNSGIDVTIAFIILSANIFYWGLNPFNLHIFDFIPFLKSDDKNIISPSVWILSMMVESSSEMAKELKNINLSVFEDVYSRIDFNGKTEIAYLYQNLLDGLNRDEYYQFFIDNVEMLFQFLDLENEEILSHMIQFFFNLYHLLVTEGNEQKLDDFLKILSNHDFPDFLENIISETESYVLQLYAKQISLIFHAE